MSKPALLAALDGPVAAAPAAAVAAAPAPAPAAAVGVAPALPARTRVVVVGVVAQVAVLQAVLHTTGEGRMVRFHAVTLVRLMNPARLLQCNQ